MLFPSRVPEEDAGREERPGVDNAMMESAREKTSFENWELIQDSLQHLNEGISIFNRELDLVLFNRKFCELLNMPAWLVKVGVNFSELIRYNAERGEYGPGDVDTQVRERVALAKQFEPHSIERVRPDGSVLEIRGNPVPGGGFVTIYTDITLRKRMESRLHEMATTDDLTGVNNRRRFFDLATIEVNRAKRFGSPLSFIMLDADRFKTVNDTYGHITGDKVLRTMADACKSNLRQVDVLSRYGGEEFAIMLPETDIEAALSVAERLRAAIAEASVETEKGPLYFTASLGVSALQAQAGDLGWLIERADSALYAAKNAGRNRVMRAF
jgi:diguanylate cyclase (GGDEF)-like protein